jgi:hypothetical protein
MRLSFIGCAVLVLLTGCNSGSGTPSAELTELTARTGPINEMGTELNTELSQGLPAIPPGRNSSIIINFFVGGDETFAHSDGAIIVDFKTALESQAGELSWAIWELNAYDRPMFLEIDLGLTSPIGADEGAYVGIADYSRGLWEIQGPFGGKRIIELDPLRHRSPGGVIYIAVLAHDGIACEVGTLELVTVDVNAPPTAGVEAEVEEGMAPIEIDFDAGDSTDPDFNISRYLWDFNGNGVFEESTTSPLNRHLFEVPGIHVVEMIVEDSNGERDSARLIIDLSTAENNRPIAELMADVDSGNAPLEVEFNAGGSRDPGGGIERFDWDFDGDGNWDSHDGPAESSFTFFEPGIYETVVSVTDTQGAQTWAELLVEVYGSYDPITLDTVADIGGIPCLSMIDGKPAISYNSYVWFGDYIEDTRYVRATDEQGLDWLGPQVLEDIPPSNHQFGPVTALTEHNDLPLVCYGMGSTGFTDGSIRFMWADDAQLGSWNPVLIDDELFGSQIAGLGAVTVDETPVICWWTGSALRYARVKDIQFPFSGISVGVWTIDLNCDQADCSMALINGIPAVSYSDFGDLCFVIALDDQGDAWDEVEVVLAVEGPIGYQQTSLAEVGGRPAIACADLDGGRVVYIRADDTTGSDWGEAQELFSGDQPDLAVIGGKPAVCGIGTGGLRYRRATDGDGDDWAISKYVAPDAWAPQMVEVLGGAGISYVDSGSLMFVSVL